MTPAKSIETVDWKRRVKDLADDTFPDAEQVKFTNIESIESGKTRKPTRRQLNINMPGGHIQFVYDGVPTPFGQMRVNGISGTMIDIPVDVTGWDDIVGFFSLARTTFDEAIASWVAHDETIERLRMVEKYS